MASHDAVKTVTLTAGEALTNGNVVQVSAARTVIKTAATNDVVVGVVAESVASGSDVPVALLQGIVEVIAGTGGVTAGELCVPDATGTVTGVADLPTLAVDQMAVGIALNTAVAGEVFEMLAQPISGANV